MRWSLLVLAAACGEERAGDTATPVDEICLDAPARVTWETFGDAFFTQNCQSCHSGELTGDERGRAPLEVSFDTEEEVWAQRVQILAMATGDEPRMPPEGGVATDDRYLLEVYLRCSAPAG